MDGSEIVLKDLIDYNCSIFLYDNARFYAERLFYTNPKSENLFLLAKCYRGLGKLKQVYHLLRDDKYPPNRYHFAQVCIELGKYQEAQCSLLPSSVIHPNNLAESDVAFIPGGAAGLYLLGITCRKENRKDFAVAYFQKALQMDKTCWGAYCELCEMGASPEAENLYGIKIANAFDVIRAQQPPVGAASERRRIAESINDTRNSPCTAASLGLSSVALRVGFATPGGMPSSVPSPVDMLPLSTSMLGTSVASSHMAHSGYAVPFSAMAGAQTQHVSKRPGGGDSHNDFTPATAGVAGNNLFCSPPTGGGIHSDLMQTDLRRVALASGRGDTGGPNTADIGGRLFGTPDSEADVSVSQPSIRNIPSMGDFDTPGLTPISARRLSTDVGDMSSYHLQMSEDLEDREAPSAEEMRLAFRNVTEAGAADGSRRRVSFGPSIVGNSRLSFSSAADSGETLQGQRSADDEDYGPEDSPDLDMPPPKSKLPRTAWLTDEGVGRLSVGSRSRIPRVGGGRATSTDSLQQPLTRQSRVDASASHSRPLGSTSKSPVRSRSGSSSLSPSRPSTRSSTGKLPRGSLSPSRSTVASRASAAVSAQKRELAQETSPVTSPSASRRSRASKTPAAGLRDAGTNESLAKEKEEKGYDGTKDGAEGVPVGEGGEKMRALVEAGELMVLSLLTVFGEAYRLVNLYRCQECIRHLQQLPRSCGLVQHIMGRAHFELNDYKSAQLALREMLRLEPFRVAGTEILSTALWHLKRDKELCALAQQVVEIDKMSPETWCVVGNCFSLQQEHEAAIKFFDRAVQVDPSFTYARTLCGHEYVCNEDLDKATASFRQAIYHDDRHYNAWYGLGTIFYRQERLELAEYHFRRAISINPTSSVLRCYLGMVLNSYNRIEKNLEAIDILKQAMTTDPRNPQLQFQLAHVLLTNGAKTHLQDAIVALQIAREHAPKEPPVYALLGQVCYKLGKNQDALRYFNTAIDLDPKQATFLKATIDLIQDPYMMSGGDDDFYGVAGDGDEDGGEDGFS